MSSQPAVVPFVEPGPVDFRSAPFLVIWEATRACDLKCVHCRAEALPLRHSKELTREDVGGLIAQVRELGNPLFVITGGDPLKRDDIFDIVRDAANAGLRVAMTPSGTPLLTAEAIQCLRNAGLARLAVSLDGSGPAVHDAFRQVDGSFDVTVAAIRTARGIGLPVQINTTVSTRNVDDLSRIAALIVELDIVLWSVFFLVPTGRGERSDVLSAAEHEAVFHRLYDLSKRMPYDIKTTAAQHYRRVVLQRRRKEAAARAARGLPAEESRSGATGGRGRSAMAPGLETGGWRASGPGDASIGRAAMGVNDGNGMIFVDHIGQICPSGFLPIVVGDVRRDRLADVYRNHPVLRQLREPSGYGGKCGSCDFRDLCGGSRSRAFALTGDYLASDPSCCYRPPKPRIGL